MKKSYDAILLVGFGGPQKPEEIIPFLQDVTHGKDIPVERLQKVAKQYEEVGGSSPYNRLTGEQAQALEKLLKARGLEIPVVMGFAHTSPRIADTLTELVKQNKMNLFVIIMAPHRSPVSYDKYVHKINEGIEALKAQGLHVPHITYAPEWHVRPGFIKAIVDHINEAYDQLTPAEKERHRAELFFTTHSIPRVMAHKSPYSLQFEQTAQAVMNHIDIPYYQTAYTSRSGKPDEVWLEPDLGDFLAKRTYETLAACVVAPIGFLVDHMEVLYDIDVVAQEKAKWKALHLVRAKTVGTHPAFIAMLASLIEESLA